MEHGYCGRRITGTTRCDQPAEVMVVERHVGVGDEGGDVESAAFLCQLHSELRAVETPNIEQVIVTRLV
jgi:hypothetical protein